MAVGLQEQVFNFIGGKITEATPFTQPPNTARELINVDINQFGQIRRRLGLDFEAGAGTIAIPSSELSAAVSVYKWKASSDAGISSYIVSQIAATLYFYDARAATLTAGYLGRLDLAPYSTGPITEALEFSSGLGKLFVNGTTLTPLYITYSGSTFTATTIAMKIRDFSGVDDGYAVDYRPTEAVDGLTAAHRYNLGNQGWPETAPISDSAEKPTLEHFHEKLDAYPSNSDVFFQFKNATDYYFPKAPVYITSGAAAKGKYIIDPLLLNREEVSGISGLSASFKETVPVSRPAVGAFWYGRYVTGGLRDDGHTGKLFISKLLEDISEAGIFYQLQDPTTENLNALLATDGLVLTVAEMSTVHKIVPLGKSLIILASNGVWELSGGADTGFTSEAYSINKLSETGTTYKGSVVVAESVVLFWSNDGIYLIAPDKSTGNLSVTNISRDKIETDYLAIPGDSRANVGSFFDRATGLVYWMYHSTGSNVAEGRMKFASNAMLILNLRSGAFYDYEIGELVTSSPFVLGMTKLEDTTTSTTTEDVYDSLGATVVDSAAADVYASVSYIVSQDATIKLFAYYPTGSKLLISAAQFSDTAFVDWRAANGTGIDAPASVLTGHNVGTGQEGGVTGARRRSTNYIITHFNQTETAFATSGGVVGFNYPSSCKLRARWDFDGTGTFGKWSDQWEVYRLTRPFVAGASGDAFDYGRTVVTTKNRLRGSGKAVQLHFTSTAGKDMQLLGWEATSAMSGKV